MVQAIQVLRFHLLELEKVSTFIIYKVGNTLRVGAKRGTGLQYICCNNIVVITRAGGFGPGCRESGARARRHAAAVETEPAVSCAWRNNTAPSTAGGSRLGPVLLLACAELHKPSIANGIAAGSRTVCLSPVPATRKYLRHVN